MQQMQARHRWASVQPHVFQPDALLCQSLMQTSCNRIRMRIPQQHATHRLSLAQHTGRIQRHGLVRAGKAMWTQRIIIIGIGRQRRHICRDAHLGQPFLLHTHSPHDNAGRQSRHAQTEHCRTCDALAPKGAFHVSPAEPGKTQCQPHQSRHRQRRQRRQIAIIGKDKHRLMPQIGTVTDQPHADQWSDLQYPPRLGQRVGKQNHQRRPQGGHQRIPPRPGHPVMKKEHRPNDHGQSQSTAGPCPSPWLWIAMQIKGAKDPHQQFPSPRRQQIKSRTRLVHSPPLRQPKAQHKGHDQKRHHKPPCTSPNQHQKQRKEDVKLFLDRQRPCVQQRLEMRCHIEIPSFFPEHDI